MEKRVETTEPLAPTGVTNTEVPLGVTATLATQEISDTQIVFNNSLCDPTKWIWIDSFKIRNATLPGQRIYNWSMTNPLKSKFQSARIEESHTLITILPKALFYAYYCRFGQVDWEVMLQPVKIGDCRVELDIVFKYNSATPDLVAQTLDRNQLLSDSLHYELDDVMNPPVFKVPAYWKVSQPPMNDVFADYDTNFSKRWIKPLGYPDTSFFIYQRTRYINNQLQMDSFDVNVYVRPITSGLSCFATRSLTSVNNGSLTMIPYIPKPYWLEQDVPVYKDELALSYFETTYEEIKELQKSSAQEDKVRLSKLTKEYNKLKHVFDKLKLK